MSTPDVVTCFRIPLWRKVQRRFRFHTIPRCEVPFVEGTYFSSKRVRSFLTCSFSFFKPLLCWHVPYIFYRRRFWSSQHIWHLDDLNERHFNNSYSLFFTECDIRNEFRRWFCFRRQRRLHSRSRLCLRQRYFNHRHWNCEDVTLRRVSLRWQVSTWRAKFVTSKWKKI